MKEKEKCMINMLIKIISVEKGQSLWSKGEKSDLCFFVKSGEYQLKNFSQIIVQDLSIEKGTLLGDFNSLL
jgi:hypothetical protein